MSIARVLIVAGSDSGGGAGVQADIKAVTMMGGHAMTAITAITVQNTLGVSGVVPVPPDAIVAQMRAVIDDIGVDAVKTGMLGDAATIEAVADVLQELHGGMPIIVDPVMVAKGGASLLANEAVGALKTRLVPLASLLTPNAPELEVLSGMIVTNPQQAAEAAATLGPAVLAKGGHLQGTEVVDQLVTAAGIERWAAPRIDTRHTHGTGCTLASAIAAGVAGGLSLAEAIARAREYVRAAMLAAPGLGRGHGPLGHALGGVPYEAMTR